MAGCEVCGNDYRLSFECAIQALAPVCEHCGVKVVGHGVEADGVFFCGASRARVRSEQPSTAELVARAGRAPDER